MSTSQEEKSNKLYNYEELVRNFPFDRLMQKTKSKFDAVPIERIDQLIKELTDTQELYTMILENPEASEFYMRNKEYLDQVAVTLDQLKKIRELRL